MATLRQGLARRGITRTVAPAVWIFLALVAGAASGVSATAPAQIARRPRTAYDLGPLPKFSDLPRFLSANGTNGTNGTKAIKCRNKEDWRRGTVGGSKPNDATQSPEHLQSIPVRHVAGHGHAHGHR